MISNRDRVMGRLSGHVPDAGELVPDVIFEILHRVVKEKGLEGFKYVTGTEAKDLVQELNLPVRRPTLCPGCPHRSAFFVIRKFSPKAIFTSDIGCYTLGLNLGAVDTCLDMGAAITIASGLYQSFSRDGKDQPIIATIGDSTFYHSGPAGLINAVYNGARFILVILDNQTTAMTGMQPTPGLGIRADGSPGKTIALERLVAGCGVDYIDVVDPYDQEALRDSLKKASEYTKEPEGGIAVIVSRHPCVIAYRDHAIPERKKIVITDDCKECNLCIERFECPAIYHDQEKGKAEINQMICAGCTQCVPVCPKGAIQIREEKEVK
jgi:indolepyruvate ferredoxin oxidoreductase alpha subunit